MPRVHSANAELNAALAAHRPSPQDIRYRTLVGELDGEVYISNMDRRNSRRLYHLSLCQGFRRDRSPGGLGLHDAGRARAGQREPGGVGERHDAGVGEGQEGGDGGPGDLHGGRENVVKIIRTGVGFL